MAEHIRGPFEKFVDIKPPVPLPSRSFRRVGGDM